ncbi:MAG: lamin tail domain-containing protein [Planctomycetota bacterium]
MNRIALLLACCAGTATSANGQVIIGDNEGVIITEIMFNPAGAEADTEWVEITNISNQPVDVTRYAIDDEDGSSPGNMLGSGAIRNPDGSVLPESTDIDCTTVDIFGGQGFQCDPENTLILAPGESIIVGSFWDTRSQGFGGSVDNGIENTFDDWVAAWGDDTDGDGFGDVVDYRIVFLISNITIANTGSPINEVLDLIEYEEDGTIISRDYVNYEVGNSQNQWPFSSNGLSFYLQPNFLADAAAQTAGSAAPPANGSLENSNQSYGVFWSNSAAGRDLARNPVEILTQDMDAGPNGDGLDENGDPILVTLISDNDAASPGVVPNLGQSFEDANGNGRDDVVDIFLGFSQDCNRNRIPDETEPDCNGNGLPDDCEFQISQESDCDGNGSPDSCDIAFNASLDLDGNGVLDSCESSDGFGDIVITEILFNPSGSEGGREFVELINIGTAPVNLAGAFLQDLDAPVFDTADAVIEADVDTDGDGVADAFFLNPGEVLVIGETSLENFEAGWGPVSGFRYIDPAGSLGLGNNADLVNEVRSILAADGTRLDVANYQSTTSNGVPQGDWPGDYNGASYYLLGDSVNTVDNNTGTNWATSIRNLNGQRAGSGTFFADDTYASPGTVNIGAPERPVGDVIISEVHFASNTEFPGLSFPDPTNGIDEWVEIVNVSNAPVDISGWFLEDEDGRTTPIPAGTTLAAGEALVLTGNDFPAENPTPVSEFYAAWDCGYQVITLQDWYGGGIGRLSDQAEGPGAADSPSGANEILQLRDASDMVQDIVNYDDDGFEWPLVSNGLPLSPAFSIYVFNPSAYNELGNDNGLNWATSLIGFDGAIQNNLTDVYNTTLFGSPGFVDGITVGFDPNNCISDDPVLPLCADQNRDGLVTPADFTSWVLNFNNNDLLADANQDGLLSPADFTAWILAFNQGLNGPLCQ